jgi:hypothetical protein
MNFSKMTLIGFLITFSQFSLAVDCFELGPQAELSVHINSTTRKGLLNIGEEIKFKAKKQNVGGSLASYIFKANDKNYSLSVLNEMISNEDNRYHGTLTDLDSLERTFLA